MCGIAGIFDPKHQLHIRQELLRQMTDTLVHRGPDDEGFFVDQGIGLGFRRLSIIDLAGGSQPMMNEDSSVWMVCNGEIYNYKELKKGLLDCGHTFATNCDVEVLIHLYEEYGMDFLRKLNGQFAFAIYDKNRRSLFLGRDHVGIAPLFYTICKNVLVFASEIKAILKYPGVHRRVHLQALDQVFSFPGMVSPSTMFEGIHSLKPGHFLEVSEDKIEEHLYWDLDYPQEYEVEQERPESYYVDGLNERLLQAVKYRLHADVPVGLYVSGGLDSSIIAGMVKKLSPEERKRSFSILFEEAAIDERKHQRLVAERLGSMHHEALFKVSDIEAKLKSIIYYAEAPLKETYNTCSLMLSELVAKNNIKVVLTGEGADELFAGYVGYRFDRKRAVLADGYPDPEEAIERELRYKLWGDEDFIYDKNYNAFTETKRAIYSESLNERFEDFDALCEGLINKSRITGRDTLHKRSYLDFKLRLSDHLLADHGDRVAYASSIEARYPFLDINLIEFARMIPPSLKMKGLEEKYILKKCAASYVPQEIIGREKFSFVAQGSPYLLKENKEWINDLLSYETIKRQGYFNPDAIERLKKLYRAPGFSLNQTFESDLLMIVLTFGIFLDLFDMPDLN